MAFTIAIRTHHLKWIVAMHTFMRGMRAPRRTSAARGLVRFRNRLSGLRWRAAAVHAGNERAAWTRVMRGRSDPETHAKNETGVRRHYANASSIDRCVSRLRALLMHRFRA
ncbi:MULTISPECIES: hypothetical protein [Burkholderia]|uniref:Uncharacterized protein n=1 Tax=Burkholderia humptydooensis TaxID=430531 RepID=A0A7T2X2K4_9BURK|nr:MULTISPECIES: hypothetical protein [Burkholderia]QPS48058.1 hypothetical protein I6G56_30240 [Burkholderia humptydooensis]